MKRACFLYPFWIRCPDGQTLLASVCSGHCVSTLEGILMTIWGVEIMVGIFKMRYLNVF
jgi:hypothetical protein